MAHEPDDGAIPTATCWELLRSGWFGRVALSVDALPAILPVEYCLVGEEVAMCLGQGRASARSLDNAVVGFAADSIDPVTHSGWTVQVQGVTRLPRPSDEVGTGCGQAEHGQIVFVAPRTINGRRLHLCPFGTGLPTAGLP